MKTKIQTKSAVIVIFLIAILITGNSSAQTFTRIDTSIVCTFGGYSYAGFFGDCNNDGLDDLIILSASTTPEPNIHRLFINEGNWNFTQISDGAIAEYSSSYGSYGAYWGDYDNDDDLDLFLANFFNNNNAFFENNGDGSFTRVTEGVIVSDGGDSGPATWIDIENDGYLDVYVCNQQQQKNFLYHNNGDGTFTRFTGGEQVNHIFNEDVLTGIVDIDNDRDDDIFGSGILESNYLYVNDGNGNFTLVESGDIIENGNITFLCAWGDYDNDGYLDVFIPTWGENYSTEYDILCHNNGDGTFTKITGIVPVNEKTGTDIGCWADFDNDGYLDLFTSVNWEAKNFLYRNNGNGTFTKQNVEAFTNDMGGWASVSDMNNDGFMDILIPRGHHDTPPNVNTIYANNGNTNSWLTVKLKGTVSNKNGIGAWVKAKATINGNPVWQVREIGVSGLAGHTNAHFGFGNATLIDSLIVQWPTGHDTILVDLAINTILTITEEMPEGYLRASYSVDTTMGRGELTVHFKDLSRFDPASPITSWSWDFNSDGTKDSDEQNPTHIYTSPLGEVYNVSLVVSNGTNNDTIVRKDLIRLYPLKAENLAQWGKATASSEESPTRKAQNTIDGEILSRWGSNATDFEWLKVEMDSVYKVGKIIIHWEAAYGSGYKILVSTDNAHWDTVYCENAGNGSEDILLFTGIDAKYIKLEGSERGTQWGYSIYELEIYRSDGNEYPETCNNTGLADNSIAGFNIVTYPNPFNESVNFSFTLQKPEYVLVEVKDLVGRKIATIYSGQLLQGQQVISWNRTDKNGLKTLPGFYVYTMWIGANVKSTGKLIVTD
jgi:enediyne biosynthesis protein E4